MNSSSLKTLKGELLQFEKQAGKKNRAARRRLNALILAAGGSRRRVRFRRPIATEMDVGVIVDNNSQLQDYNEALRQHRKSSDASDRVDEQ